MVVVARRHARRLVFAAVKATVSNVSPVNAARNSQCGGREVPRGGRMAPYLIVVPQRGIYVSHFSHVSIRLQSRFSQASVMCQSGFSHVLQKKSD